MYTLSNTSPVSLLRCESHRLTCWWCASSARSAALQRHDRGRFYASWCERRREASHHHYHCLRSYCWMSPILVICNNHIAQTCMLQTLFRAHPFWHVRESDVFLNIMPCVHFYFYMTNMVRIKVSTVAPQWTSLAFCVWLASEARLCCALCCSHHGNYSTYSIS